MRFLEGGCTVQPIPCKPDRVALQEEAASASAVPAGVSDLQRLGTGDGQRLLSTGDPPRAQEVRE